MNRKKNVGSDKGKSYSLSLSVIIPAYNEEKRITATLKDIEKFLRKNFSNFEVIVYNDGSQDKTERVVKEFIKKHRLKNFKIVTFRKNVGKGKTIKIASLKAKKDWILMMDADSATPIEDVQRLIDGRRGKEIVYGSRYLDRTLLKVRQPLVRRIIGRAGNLLARIVLKINLCDTQCGFKLFSRRAARIIFPKSEIERWGWDLEVLAIAQANNLSVVEVPVSWAHIEGSKFRASRGIRQTFLELFTIKRNLRQGKYSNNT